VREECGKKRKKPKPVVAICSYDNSCSSVFQMLLMILICWAQMPEVLQKFIVIYHGWGSTVINDYIIYKHNTLFKAHEIILFTVKEHIEDNKITSNFYLIHVFEIIMYLQLNIIQACSAIHK